MIPEPNISTYLDDEEKALVEAVEEGRLPLNNLLTPERQAEIETMARATMNDQREKITIRISRNDLGRLKSRALQEGIPYQTLINSIIHKYVST